LSEEITVEKIRTEFAETSFAAQFMEELIEKYKTICEKLNKTIEKILNKKLARAKEAYLQEIDTVEEYKNNKMYIKNINL